MKVNDPVRQSIEKKANDLGVKPKKVRSPLCKCGHSRSEHAFGDDAKTAGGNVCLHISKGIECKCIKFRSRKTGAKPTKVADSIVIHPEEAFVTTKPVGFRKTDLRDVATETNAVTTGLSSALSSKKMVYYHNIPPELYRRVANRTTGGHVKYNDKPVPITMNLNWRVGLNDPLYMMDRLNHLIEHLVCFLESGNETDDNLGAIALMAGWLMECEKHCPEVFVQLYGQQRYYGQKAEEKRKELQQYMIKRQEKQLEAMYPGFKDFARESRGKKK